MVFDRISKFWTEMADSHKTKLQIDFVKRLFSSEGLILDLASGNGRHSIKLSQEGFDIIGLDISRNLLRIATNKAFEAKVRVQFVRADMRFLPFRDRKFRGVLSLDTTIGYLQSDSEDRLTLAEIKRILKSKGKIVVDVFNLEHMIKRYSTSKPISNYFIFSVLMRLPFLCHFLKCHNFPSFRLFQKRTVDEDKKLLIDTWLFYDKTQKRVTIVKHVVRLFTLSKLRVLFEKAGLSPIIIYGDYDEKEYNTESSRLIIVGTNM
jgi:ubiquinone/menaquinone biosynthesis C-methylase UbiE